jgi:hypothetical protein
VLRLAALLVAIAAAGCSGSGDGASEGSPATREAPPAIVSGPLCDALPAGTDPGAPASLTDEPADVALQWIPVLTTFEAAVRASGIDLRRPGGVTILAPTDEAFDAAFGRQELDELLLSRHRVLRDLLEAHLLVGARSLAQLREAGSATTLAGDTRRSRSVETTTRRAGREATASVRRRSRARRRSASRRSARSPRAPADRRGVAGARRFAADRARFPRRRAETAPRSGRER